MIRTKADLLKYIAEDFGRYPSSCRTLKARFRKDFHYEVLCYLKLLRKSEYYYNNPSFINKIRYLFTTKRKNIIANRINVYIPINTCGYGLMIYHGDIVINSDARIGNCCSLHGNNCIGNKGTENATCPTIGDHVNIGWGGVIIGNVLVGDNVTIGASSFVNKDIHDNSTIYNQKQIIININN